MADDPVRVPCGLGVLVEQVLAEGQAAKESAAGLGMSAKTVDTRGRTVMTRPDAATMEPDVAFFLDETKIRLVVLPRA